MAGLSARIINPAQLCERLIMSNDLVTIDSLTNQLLIVKHQNEILQLKNELEKVQAEKASRLENSLYSPKLFEHYRQVAEHMAKSTMIPTIYKGKPDDIFVAMAYGYQLGFPIEQALQDIAVVNGRPCLWGDGLLAVVLSHPDYVKHTEVPIYQDSKSNECIGYTFTIWRKGHEPHSVTFTKEDAITAKLWGQNTWAKYPTRMMQLRARAFACRDKFADALRGIRTAELERDEPQDIIEGEVINKTAEGILDAIKKGMTSQGTGSEPQGTSSEPERTGKEPQPEQTQPEPPKSSTIRADQLETISMFLSVKNVDQASIDKIFKHFKITDYAELDQAGADRVIAHLKKFDDK